MSYSCGWGCTSPNPLCDACDYTNHSEDAYEHARGQDVKQESGRDGWFGKEPPEDDNPWCQN